MKFPGKFFMFLFFLLIFAYVILWAFVNFKVKDIAVEQLELALSRDVNIESVSFVPPLGIRVNEFAIDKTASFSELILIPDIIKTFRYGIGIKDIIINDLELSIVKKNDGTMQLPAVIPWGTDDSREEKTEQTPEQNSDSVRTVKKSRGLYLGRFLLKNAVVKYFSDPHAAAPDIELPVSKAELKYMTYPLESKVMFRLISGIRKGTRLYDNSIEFSGWLDMSRKDASADLVVREIPLSVVDTFFPYDYRPEKIGLKSAVLGINLAARAENNELRIETTLSLPEYEFAEIQEQDLSVEKTKINIAQSVLDTYRTDAGYPQYTFSYDTKLDKPDFDFEKLNGQFEKERRKLFKGVSVALVNTVVSQTQSMYYVDEQERADRKLDTINRVIQSLGSESPSASTEESVPVEVTSEPKDIEDQLEEAAVEVVGSLLKGLLDTD